MEMVKCPVRVDYLHLTLMYNINNKTAPSYFSVYSADYSGIYCMHSIVVLIHMCFRL